jgi:hypothetical protein
MELLFTHHSFATPFYTGVIKCSGTHFVSQQTTGRSLARADEYMLYVYRQIE